MAQTKRKRRSKHRGTAAGTIEVRGRTGRRSTAGEAKSGKPAKSGSAGERRANRLDTPPTWRASLSRAGIAALVFFVAVVFLFHQPIQHAVVPAVFALAIYVPMGYYLDSFLYRRRQAAKARAAGEKGAKR